MTMMARLTRVLVVAVVALTIGLVAAPKADAQISVGGGLVFTDLDPLGLGFQVNGYYGLPDVMPGLRVGGDLTYYLPETQRQTFLGESFEASLNLFELNSNAQLHFLTQEQFSVYGLGGLNFTRISSSVTVPGLGSESASDTKLGFNLGGGGEFNAGFGAVYGEVKYVIQGDNMERIVLGAGVRIRR